MTSIFRRIASILFIIGVFSICFVFNPFGFSKFHYTIKVQSKDSGHEAFTESESWVQSVMLEPCACTRSFSTKPRPNVNYENTTCSKSAYYRGPNQKVIAFTIYGDARSSRHEEQQYYQGIEENLKLMARYYPGWSMRLYYDLDAQGKQMQNICQLACQNPELDLCNASALPGTPMLNAGRVFPLNWRFFPTLDPQVDILLSRDLDSRFSSRETAAVQEWLESGRGFHAMRDHRQHDVPVLGGMWGARLHNATYREPWIKSWKAIFEDRNSNASRKEKGPDQTLLARHIWSWARGMSVQHDSYLCSRYPGSIGFPTQRTREPGNFVGARSAFNESILDKCPRGNAEEIQTG